MNIQQESTRMQIQTPVIPADDILEEQHTKDSQENSNISDENGATQQKQVQLAENFKNWQQAKEEAQNQNRNLIQYGAGIAAALGIGAGSGGIFAVSEALAAAAVESKDVVPQLVEWLLTGLIYGACVTSAILLLLIVITFVRRQRAESRATKYKGHLIMLQPETILRYFMNPKEE